MAARRGFFSIVQFCPVLDRGECANVGIVLVVPEDGYVEIRLSDDNEAPKRRFGADAFDSARLDVAKMALQGRLRAAASGLNSPDDLRRLAAREGNHLLLSSPRTIFVEDNAAELDELFQRLAHVDPRHRRRTRKPDLRSVFEPKLIGVPLIRDYEVNIPGMEEKLHVPYAYRNGALNLINPEGFPIDERAAKDRANTLAIAGNLIYRHSASPNSMKQKLIVVAAFDEDASEKLRKHVSFVLSEHNTRLVREDELDRFADEVRQQAHS